MEILTTTIFIIWIISVILVGKIYYNKDIGPGFWSIIGLIVPIINTIIAIKYGNFNYWTLDSLKNFMKELNKN